MKKEINYIRDAQDRSTLGKPMSRNKSASAGTIMNDYFRPSDVNQARIVHPNEF